MIVIQPPPAGPNPLTAAAPITIDRNSEARRAYREARTAIALLQQRWPAAFPQTPHRSPDGGNGTTASSPTQASDRRKLADTQTVPDSGRGWSKSLKEHSVAKSTTVKRP